jgi:hypothetical protein
MGSRTIDGSERTTVSNAELAELLLEFEASLGAERPERVVVADDSDTALAASLVAAKLLIPLEAMPAATETASDNARVIAQLASAYTQPA